MSEPSLPGSSGFSSPVRNHPLGRRIWERVYTALTAGAWPARLAWRLYPAQTVDVLQHTIEVASSLGGRDRLRIVFASDFHAGPTTPWLLLESCARTIEDLRPDLVLLGGDFVSLDPAAGIALIGRLSRIPAPLGRLAVLGNHDYWAGAPAVARLLREAGITLLVNRSIRLPAPFENVTITGMDDFTSGVRDAASAFTDAGGVRVLLMHEPSSLVDAGDRRFDVAVCGHTHGGQIALPGGRPVIVACGPLSRQYNAGRYELGGGRTLLVSRGVGYGALPIRFNAPSELFVCTLTHRPA